MQIWCREYKLPTKHGIKYWSEPKFNDPKASLDIEDNPIVAKILGPNGEVLSRLAERRPIKFGFQPNE